MRSDLRRMIERAVIDGFRTGKPNEVRARVKVLLRRYSARYGDYMEFLRSTIKAEQDRLQGLFMNERLGGVPEAAYRGLADAVARDGAQAAKRYAEETMPKTDPGSFSQQKRITEEMGRMFRTGEQRISLRQLHIKRLIERALRAPDGDVEGMVETQLRRIGLEERHIETELFTLRAAVDNVERMQSFADGGVVRVRYVGPSGTVRKFCAAHVGKVYTVEAAGLLVNDFGQNGYAFCGGYNCRHRWVPAVNS